MDSMRKDIWASVFVGGPREWWLSFALLNQPDPKVASKTKPAQKKKPRVSISLLGSNLALLTHPLAQAEAAG